jgi:acyl carrier protein
MTTATDFVEPLRGYLTEVHLDGRATLAADAPLLEWGIIDSLALVDLIVFVHDRFGIDVPTDEILPANFRDIHHIAERLERLAA